MITLLLFCVLCNRSPYCVIQSLSQLLGSHRWRLRFYTALLSRNFYISRAITASWLSHTYPIMLLSCTQHWLFYFLLSATILWALSCSLILDSVCLFVHSTGEKGGVEHSFVYIPGERKCQSLSVSRKQHPNGMLQAEEKVACPS